MALVARPTDNLRFFKQLPLTEDNLIKGNRKNNKLFSVSIKGLILNGLISKNCKKNYNKREALLVWYKNSVVQTLKQQAMVRILVHQRISQATFLYRIKSYTNSYKKSHPQTDNTKQKTPQTDQHEETQIKIEKIKQQQKQQQYVHKQRQDKRRQEQQENRKLDKTSNIEKEYELDNKQLDIDQNKQQSSIDRFQQRELFITHSLAKNDQASISDHFQARINKLEGRVKAASFRTCQLLILTKNFTFQRYFFYKLANH